MNTNSLNENEVDIFEPFDFSTLNEPEDEEIESTSHEETNTKLDTTEPAYSLLRYYNFRKGDATATCITCNKKIA